MSTSSESVVARPTFVGCSPAAGSTGCDCHRRVRRDLPPASEIPRLPGGQAGSAALYVWPTKASRSPKGTAWLGKSLERAIAAVVTYEAVLR